MSEHAIERQPEAQQGLRQVDEGQLRVVPEMRKRGIRVLPGGDYGFAHNPHGRNAWEMELFVRKFGFTAAETLAAATRDGAALMGMADTLGLVKPGYIADLAGGGRRSGEGHSLAAEQGGADAHFAERAFL